MNAPTLRPDTSGLLNGWKYDHGHDCSTAHKPGNAPGNPSAWCRRARKTAALSFPGVPAARPCSARLARYAMSAARPDGLTGADTAGVAERQATTTSTSSDARTPSDRRRAAMLAGAEPREWLGEDC